MDAVPLPESPNPTENDENKGVTKLVVSLAMASKETIAIAFKTSKESTTPTIKVLSDWK